MRYYLLVAAAMLAAGCNAAPGNNVQSNDMNQPADSPASAPQSPDTPVSNSGPAQSSSGMPVPPNPVTECEGVSGSDFAAWVNAMPGPGRRPTLIVTGTVTTPTGGYEVRFGGVTVMESSPVQIVAELVARAPSGSAAQVITRHKVRGEWPSETKVGSVTVRCGARDIARISPVETAY